MPWFLRDRIRPIFSAVKGIPAPTVGSTVSRAYIAFAPTRCVSRCKFDFLVGRQQANLSADYFCRFMQRIPIKEERERCALSVGQFRPEKDHAMQVRALAELRKLSNTRKSSGNDTPNGLSYSSFDDVRLVILGSCRNDDDRRVLARTRALAVELGVEERVEFVVNCSYDELKGWLGRASVGLHTMWNEHFGIGVVEMMVSGVLVGGIVFFRVSVGRTTLAGNIRSVQTLI